MSNAARHRQKWLTLLLGLTCACTGCGSGVAPVPYSLPVPTGTPRYSSYHAYGDSITYGLFLDDPATQAYPALLSRATGIPLEDYGIPGEQSCDVAPRQIFAHADNPSTMASSLFTVLIGTNDAQIEGPGPYEAVFNLCQQAALSWLAIPREQKILGNSTDITTRGRTFLETADGWNAITTGAQSSAVTIPLLLTSSGSVYLWYRLRDNSSVTFQYALDGGVIGVGSVGTTPNIQTRNGSNNSMGVLHLTAVAAGHHSFTVTQTNAGDVGVGVIGIGLAGGGFPSSSNLVLAGTITRTAVAHGPCAACEIYRADIRSNANLLMSDGLNVSIFESAKYMIGTKFDMADFLHPNAQGHLEIAHSLLDALH